MAQGQLINLRTILVKHGGEIIKNLKRNLQDDEAIASRRLMQSISFNPIKVFGMKFQLEIVMEDYWKSVDEGTKPGFRPDVQKILRWMQHKKIVPKAAKVNLTKKYGTRARKVYKDRRLALAERIANAIYRKGTIKRFGYKGSEFMSSYLDWTFEERLREDITQAIGKDIEVSITKFK